METNAKMSDTELKSLKADLVVNAKGKQCPEPLIMAKKAIDTMEYGKLMEVWSNDPGTKRDLAAWSANMGHESLGFILDHSDGVFYRIFVRKA
jgi:tRNA 2-thiouridine synthesizing protein A